MMNKASLQVPWDHASRKETEEAKSVFMKAKNQFRLIVDEEGKQVSYFREVANKGFFRIREVQLSDTQLAVRILNETGDETVIWDSSDPDEVKEAAERFQGYLDKGWRAFAIDSVGDKHRRIRRFNAELEEIVFEEGSVQKLKEFVKAFRKIDVTPKTWPG